MRKDEILAKLKALPYDPKEYWVVAGAAMVLYGIREETSDIDLGCTREAADRLEADGYPCRNTQDGNRWFLIGDGIEAFENWLYDAVVSVEGIPTISVRGLIEMKTRLGREKDRQDLDRIRRWLADRETHFFGGAGMQSATREKLAEVAEEAARKPFHGYVNGQESNLAPIIAPFPGWTPKEADGLWCAAFVYYCCKEAGFEIPIRPDGCSCRLAGCIAWEEWAIGDERIEYHRGPDGCLPEPGDIVLYDRVFEGGEHDHIGIVLEKRADSILAAEGNVNNVSGVVERPIDEHIRGFIRLPDGYRYPTGGNLAANR